MSDAGYDYPPEVLEEHCQDHEHHGLPEDWGLAPEDEDE